MKWYHYLMCFFGGVFAANFFPHFVSGVTGVSFPTPFANPPGEGLSPPIVNVGWALFNMVVAYLLLRGGRFSNANRVALIVAFVGFGASALMLATVFGSLPPR